MNILVALTLSIAIAFVITILIMIMTKYVIFLGAILSKSYSSVQLNIKSELIALFILVVSICYTIIKLL